MRQARLMSLPFPEPAIPVSSRTEVFLGYLDYFRSRLLSKLEALPGGELRRSRLPSGWTPIELLKHLAHDELRWLEWVPSREGGLRKSPGRAVHLAPDWKGRCVGVAGGAPLAPAGQFCVLRGASPLRACRHHERGPGVMCCGIGAG